MGDKSNNLAERLLGNYYAKINTLPDNAYVRILQGVEMSHNFQRGSFGNVQRASQLHLNANQGSTSMHV